MPAGGRAVAGAVMTINASDSIGAPLIEGNTRITFKGVGRSRWRLQHTGSCDGEPFSLGWTDVTFLSDLKLDNPHDAVDENLMVRGFLAEWIDGTTEVLYRRYSADYLRAIPFDAENVVNENACMAYTVTFEPIP